jgi:hypothetical protein
VKERKKNFIDLREMKCIRETEISQLYGNSIPYFLPHSDMKAKYTAIYTQATTI